MLLFRYCNWVDRQADIILGFMAAAIRWVLWPGRCSHHPGLRWKYSRLGSVTEATRRSISRQTTLIAGSADPTLGELRRPGSHKVSHNQGEGGFARPVSIVSDISLHELRVHVDQVAAAVNASRGYSFSRIA